MIDWLEDNSINWYELGNICSQYEVIEAHLLRLSTFQLLLRCMTV